MDIIGAAQGFLEVPSEKALEKIVELVKENPAAAVAIVTVFGMAYVAKLGIEAAKD
ncbi:hypothetical protein [Bordetella hinzii]|uniref:hypothetical protein n=1 Tax=Bordetella hinzii TaxID=103855 RepID=UPI00045AC500|nr:hypothetical protein [Bordetella hinzii]AKQ61188.1 hypothetical protein ACR55_03338 [Bordetella hinzii]KCB52059.1 hypothetical protein L537_2665 [Bordetella hinzii 1277]MBZ0075791.1 hypothetical protein [Bordetella hinzii]MBZ0080933.1 hypothetical protein [Bordetella hinzii]MBZ0085338.1 hypothetical protein [Bordetella hinzii]